MATSLRLPLVAAMVLLASAHVLGRNTPTVALVPTETATDCDANTSDGFRGETCLNVPPATDTCTTVPGHPPGNARGVITCSTGSYKCYVENYIASSGPASGVTCMGLPTGVTAPNFVVSVQSTSGGPIYTVTASSGTIPQAAFKGGSDGFCISTYSTPAASASGSTFAFASSSQGNPQSVRPDLSNWAVCWTPCTCTTVTFIGVPTSDETACAGETYPVPTVTAVDDCYEHPAVTSSIPCKCSTSTITYTAKCGSGTKTASFGLTRTPPTLTIPSVCGTPTSTCSEGLSSVSKTFTGTASFDSDTCCMSIPVTATQTCTEDVIGCPSVNPFTLTEPKSGKVSHTCPGK